MIKQKIIFNSTFTLFCAECGAVMDLNLIPNDCHCNSVSFSLLGKQCPICDNNSEFSITRSEIKRLLIIN